ncbi:MAG: glutathione peroxidase [Bacteroidales bacterium]|nr:glutathione peroxidase [Bacteroidales bacterium]
MENVHNFKSKSINGQIVDFSDYEGKPMLIVNTASKCGFTGQYEGLEELNKKYADQGLVILGFPCNQFLGQEPGLDGEISEFCTMNYGVSFRMFSKIDVNGKDESPLYTFLKAKAPFQGFPNKEIGDKLTGILKENSPEFIEGDNIKWNFTKFLVSKDGKTIKRFESSVSPKEMEEEIEKML